MRSYELTTFLDTSVGQQDANDLLGRCSSFIQDNGGLVESQEIKNGIVLRGPKEQKTVCSMAVLRCSLDPEKIAGLNAYLAKDEAILRSALLEAKAKQKFAPAMTRPFALDRAAREEKPKEAINVADIDKEIEEIVNA